MDLDSIYRALAIMNDYGLTEVTVNSGDEAVTLKRSLPLPLVAQPQTEDGGSPGEAQAVREAEAAIAVVSAGMVGVMRLTDRHGTPIITEGARVAKGQMVCVVEAMKIRHEIRSEIDGTVVEIITHDGRPVEYGQPLLAIRQEG